MTKAERFEELIFKKLNSFSTYEEKHKYINETVVNAGKDSLGNEIGQKKISEFIDRYPEVKTSINEHMLQNALSDYGNPQDEGFTFSKDVSNKKLLETIDAIAKNQEIIESRFGGDEGFETMTQDIIEKKGKRKELIKEKDDIIAGLKARKKEYSERMGWSLAGPEFGNWDEEGFSGGDLLDIALGIPGTILFEGANIIQQIGAGWTDIGKEEGTQKVERANLVWDHENQTFGYGPEFEAQQDRLQTVLNEIELMGAVDQEYKAYEELQTMQDERLKLLSGTIVDDLIGSGYSTEEEIRTLLGE
jgi:hypothetical protein